MLFCIDYLDIGNFNNDYLDRFLRVGCDILLSKIFLGSMITYIVDSYKLRSVDSIYTDA